MSDPTLRLAHPRDESFAPDLAETRLRELYAHAPGHVRLGMIVSTDGRAAGPDGSSRSINGAADLRILRTLRSLADVVLVGARTAVAEQYDTIRLRPALAQARDAMAQSPTPELAIVSHSGDLPPALDRERTWLITTAGAPAASDPAWDGRRIVTAGPYVDFSQVFATLAEHGLSRVLCEGGPSLAGNLLEQRQVDDYCLTTSPAQGGPDQEFVPRVPRGFERAHLLSADGFRMERWVRPA